MSLEIMKREKVKLLTFDELPEKIKDERIDDYESIGESTFFLYRDYYYDLNNFMRLDHTRPEDFKGYDGYQNDTYFSGVLVSYTLDESDDDYGDNDYIMVAMYYG